MAHAHARVYAAAVCVAALLLRAPTGAAQAPEPQRETNPPPAPAAPSAAPATESPAPPEAATPEPERAPEPDRRVVQLRRGDNLPAILRANAVPDDQARAALTAFARVYRVRDLREGHEITLIIRDSEQQITLLGIQFSPTLTRLISIERDNGGYRADARDVEVTREPVRVRATISGRVYATGIDAGVPASVMSDFIRAFSFTVDFQREVQPGDAIEVIYDRLIPASGGSPRVGGLVYGALILQARQLRVFRHVLADGTRDFFNEQGEGMRRALLRTPVSGARLTSRFGMRGHPILGYTRMHQGVDFGAPAGAPILAAGDGTVEFMGRGGGYGNLVRIRHGGDLSTAYAHMSRFARGLRQGIRVRQGQVIGYVGATGLATGPHLHYEVHRNGRPVNPAVVRFAAQRRITGAEVPRFAATRTAIDALLTPPAAVAAPPAAPAAPPAAQ